MSTEKGVFAMGEIQRHEVNVSVIAPEGMGYGDVAGISVRKQIESGELIQESLTAAIDIVINDSDVFVAVDSEASDDGCGDGRPVRRIYQLIDSSSGEVKEFSRSLRRAKLFGGGLTASSSMWRAVDGVPVNGQTLRGDREFMARELNSAGIQYGAHTDNHAHDEKCGCGAIDRYNDITHNATRFKNEITGTLRILYGEDFDDNIDAIESTFDIYAQLNESYSDGMTGREMMSFIESEGAIVKELSDEHLEDLAVLNDIEGTTLDQEKMRQKLSEKGLSPNIQCFVVDVWRGRMYADFVAQLAVGHGYDYSESYKKAYADFLIRTCAVSATLTAGDQPVIYRNNRLSSRVA